MAMRQLSTTSVGLGLKRELIPQLQAHDGELS